MTLLDFEKQIDITILNRGKNYFNSENIDYLEQIEKGYWVANVVGSDDYNVEIWIGTKNTIKKYSCDCAFDQGGVCKHIVAVLYAISEKNTIELKSETTSKTPTFNTILKNIELKDFQEFVMYYSKKNRDFKQEFDFFFAQKSTSVDMEKVYVNRIKSIIKKHTSGGFIDYSSSNRLGKELDSLLETANQNVIKKNYRDAVVTYQVIIKEVSKVFEYCDDSNGYIGGCVESAINELNKMVNAPVSFAFKEKMYEFLNNELKKEIYFDYGDFGYNLVKAYEDLCIVTQKNDAFLAFLETKIQSNKNDDYEKRFLIQNKISFLTRIGKQDQVLSLIQENLQIPEIRKLEVEKMIKKQEYKTAKKLIADGIKIAEEKKHPGTVSDWEKRLLEIAVLEKDIEKERFFSQKFAFDRALNTSYYKQWKNTFSKENWTKTIEELILGITNSIIEKNKKNNYFGKEHLHSDLLYHLGPIYVQENYLDRLLLLVQKQDKISTVLYYYSHLKIVYPRELLDKLILLLENEGDRSASRSEYNELARKMKSIINDYPKDKERILEVARKLKQKYPRRPAMLEELNKLF